jgi:hypothetical protein
MVSSIFNEKTKHSPLSESLKREVSIPQGHSSIDLLTHDNLKRRRK